MSDAAAVMEEEVTEEAPEAQGTEGAQQTGAETPAAAPETPEQPSEPEAANDDWRADLPDDLKKTAERFTSKEDAIRAIVNFQKREGQVRVPGKDADEKEIAAYHKAIGVPESAEGYEFPEVPEGLQTEETEAAHSAWAEVFKAQNISKAQGEALAEAFYASQAKGMEALNAADKAFAEQQMAQLKTEWPGDEFERNQNLANRALGAISEKTGVSLEELTQIEDKNGNLLLDRADMLKIFATFGREMAEGRLDAPATESERESLDQQIEAARKEIAEAQAKGDSTAANKAYRKEMDLIARRDGDDPIIGVRGRQA